MKAKKNLYFLSDAHLAFKETDHEKEKREKLLQLLDFIQSDESAKAVYLLGDIFDFWFEWYHVVPKYWFPIFYRFRQLVDAGIQVNFITGNHDFYFSTYLQKEVRLNCFDESHIFEEEGRRFFIAHGDGYAQKDRGYRFLKKVIRNPLSIFLFKTFIPADLGMQIARFSSKSSRNLVKIEKTAWSEEYARFARRKFDEGFDYVLLGHIHFPMALEEKNKTYINCGDWMTQFTYAKYDGSALTLKRWNNGEEAF